MVYCAGFEDILLKDGWQGGEQKCQHQVTGCEKEPGCVRRKKREDLLEEQKARKATRAAEEEAKWKANIAAGEAADAARKAAKAGEKAADKTGGVPGGYGRNQFRPDRPREGSNFI